MLGLILSYFLPLERCDGRWQLSHSLMKHNIHLYLIRNGVPFLLFWALEVYFLTSNLLLFVICLIISLPFALSFGVLFREYRDQRFDC